MLLSKWFLAPISGTIWAGKIYFFSIHIYISRAFSWNKNFWNFSTKSTDISQNIDFPKKSYIAKKINHFEKIKNVFHGSQPYSRLLLLIISSSQKYSRNLSKLAWFCLPNFSENFLLYQTMQKLSNWNIFLTNTSLLARPRKKKLSFFMCLQFDVKWQKHFWLNRADKTHAILDIFFELCKFLQL